MRLHLKRIAYQAMVGRDLRLEVTDAEMEETRVFDGDAVADLGVERQNRAQQALRGPRDDGRR